ncbi:uncharacterized protein LOC134824068 [Bolinopsis microptera]|uniref:uncharacterized protein LOC134824068 n=1 Tax=Bolinopsis microptera TaxID=2820187 RepID=UPI003079127B
MMLVLLVIALLAPSQVFGLEGCSSGDTAFMCKNLNVCWTALGFASRDDLKYLCEIQGFTYDDEGGSGSQDDSFVVITTPPRNLTVAEGTAAAFRCSADNALRIVIIKNNELNKKRLQDNMNEGNPTQQTTIQEIDAAFYEHEGWYTCTAYGVGGTSVSSEAYLEIRDICGGADCQDPKICEPDAYTGEYECVCPGDCDAQFDPVCGSDCASYFNECTLKKETCEKGLVGVTVASRGLCSFSPTAPQIRTSPSDAEYKRGSDLNLEASATGTPEPSYVWFANGVQVGEGNVFTGTMKSNFQGDWEVKAANCHGSFETAASFRLSMVTDEDLTPPDDQCCKVYGDPHILTFDGKAYDYMGIGTFVIAQHEEGLWVVYGNFEACGDKTKQLSCVTSITVFYENEKVQFLRMWRINNNGKEFMVPLGGSRYIGGIFIENIDLKYVATLGSTGVKVKWDGIVTSQVCVSKCAGNTGGLCANANCDAGDEFLSRGFMNPYTGSWAAASSSEFGNSWAVDPDTAVMEPEDGALPIYRDRPCDAVPAEERSAVEARCNAIMNLGDFNILAEGNVVDSEKILANCYFDGCAGLVFGAGCKTTGDGSCTAEIEDLIAAAIAAGMSMAEAIAKYGSQGLDSACMMGMELAGELERWGVDIGSGWREQVSPPCPGDQEIAAMKICPT